MKCKLCDSEGAIHMCEVHDGESVSRFLCAEHARTAGLPVPSLDEMTAAVITKTRKLADFLRTHRRMPSPNELSPDELSPSEFPEIGGFVGPPRNDTEEDIDRFIAYFESLAQFADQNARLPTDDEIPDPF